MPDFEFILDRLLVPLVCFVLISTAILGVVFFLAWCGF